MLTISSARPVTRSVIEERTTVIRGSTLCELPISLRRRGLISRTLLTYQLHLRWSKSHELWSLQTIRIRMSMPLHTWLSLDNCNLPIGITLTLSRNHNRNQWCDYCKLRWGQLNGGEWHPKAKQPAVWVCTSETPYRKGRKRFYCHTCAQEVQNWSSDIDDVTNNVFWSLKEQLEYAIGQGEFDINV